MGMDSPLFLTKIECPVCGTINEFETIRVGAYTEGERQTDFCPTIIKWRNPRYQKYHPLLFFTVTCSKCFYTREFNNAYKEWSKDNNFRIYRQKVIKEHHMEELSSGDSFVNVIGQSIDHEKYPDESAILKMSLAAYDELLYDHPAHLDLGRFYLRIAWMFRFMNAGNATVDKAPRPMHIDDIERAINDLNNWMTGLSRNTEYLINAVDAYCVQVAGSNSEIESEKENYTQLIESLKDLGSNGTAILNDLKVQLKVSKASAGVVAGSGSGEAFYNCGSFSEFLSGLRRYWDGIACSEMEAIRIAVKYYIAAFESGKQIAKGNPTLQAAYLIAELSRQIGDHDTARQYFNNTIKTGQEFINEIRGDRIRTALARKILEMAMKQGKKNLAEAK
ncbi:MAG: DUF2225 domain-containing protein [candidate division Zixibacteria bacterium]